MSTITDLALVEMVNGLNENLEGFVTVRAVDPHQTISLVGQITPAEARMMALQFLEVALQFLEVAESAEHDAMVARQLVELDPDRDSALKFVAMLRAQRERGR